MLWDGCVCARVCIGVCMGVSEDNFRCGIFQENHLALCARQALTTLELIERARLACQGASGT